MIRYAMYFNNSTCFLVLHYILLVVLIVSNFQNCSNLRIRLSISSIIRTRKVKINICRNFYFEFNSKQLLGQKISAQLENRR